MLIPDWIAKNAQHFPEKTALVDLHDGRRLSYGEMHQRIARAAAFMRDEWKLKRGDRIAILAHNSNDYVELLHACGRIGVVLVCLNWRLSVEELNGIVADSGPIGMIYSPEFAASANAVADASGINNRLEIGADYEARLAAVPAPGVTEIPGGWHQHDEVWYLLYTSGTTGKPKGVIQTWGVAFTNAINCALSAGLRREDTLLSILPYFHTGGLNLYMNPMLAAGGTTLIMRQFDVDRTMALLESEVNVMFGVPAIYLFLSQHARFDAADFSRVRSWGCGGAPIPKTLLEKYLAKNVTICFGFGMTETGPMVFLTDEATARRKVGTVGKPVMYVETCIVDSATRQPLGPNERGELLIRGPGITPGYWNNAEATAKSFEDGWLCSGDIAYIDEEGDYYIVDRSKDMYISGGENVYPAEVENVIFQMPGVAEVAVIGVEDAKWGEVGKAIIALKPGASETQDDVIAHCRSKLAAFKAPKYVVFIPALPRNAAGKVEKPRLREHYGKAP